MTQIIILKYLLALLVVLFSWVVILAMVKAMGGENE